MQNSIPSYRWAIDANAITDTNADHGCSFGSVLIFLIVVIVVLWVLYSIYNYFTQRRYLQNNENFDQNKLTNFDQYGLAVNDGSPQIYLQNDIEACAPNIPYYDSEKQSLQASGDFPGYDNDYANNEIIASEDISGIQDYTMLYNQCSASCCTDQWPVPFDLPNDLIDADKGDFVPSDYSCNNGLQNSGCLCMNKGQGIFLQNRGNNK